MSILSINKGRISDLVDSTTQHGKSVLSAINKKTVSGPDNPVIQRVGYLGLEGDEQANLVVHGGTDKAIYAYPYEHYEFWTECLAKNNVPKQMLTWGTFGENLTIKGFNESTVFVGDQWLIGECLLEVVKFREPCFKFNIKMGWNGAAKAMIQSKRSGWYLRVLKTGSIKSGDLIEVLPGKHELSIIVQSSSFYNKSDQKDLWA